MRRRVQAIVAAFAFFATGELLAQTCSFSDPNAFKSSCTSPIAAGGSSTCTISVTNLSTGTCTGTWTSAIGTFDPGTVTNARADALFGGACLQVSNVALPLPVLGHTVIDSAFACQGSGSLQPGASASMTATVTPSASFTGNFFSAAYLLKFQSSGNTGTTGATSWGSIPIDIQSCTATPTVVGSAPSGVPYVVSWNSTSGIGGYEIQEAATPAFSDATTFSEAGTSGTFVHTVTAATTFYYRVRPVSCGGQAGTYGPSAQIVVLPQQPPTSRDFDLVVPLGSTTPVSQVITYTGLPPGATFNVTTDKTFLTVTPSSGTVRSDGTVTVTVTGNPSNLSVGANTGTVIVTVSTGKGGPVPNDTTTVSKPVSISLVTPVNPVPKGAPPNDALIVPAVAHLEGVVPFRSDVRITNAGTAPATYLLSFTPSGTDGTTSGRQTTITVAPDQTVALNDVLRDFFGFSLPTDQAGGVLDIRVISGSSASTFVSSRTFAATTTGTFGQFIPAVPLSRFLKNGGGALTLTQVSQTDAFRTNIGLVEGLGAPVNGRLRVFDGSGASLGEFPFNLRPFEFVQFGSFLASKGITAANARVEAVVDSTTGGLSTYASVLDNKTNDPLLVSPIQTSSVSANRYVLPGMADFASAFSNFHSDIRIFNPSAAAVTATATFYPQGNPSASSSQAINVAAGEIKAYNNVLPTLFNVTGTGGAIVISTAANATLVVSGRTYSNDAVSGGTFGQFIPAVTPAEGVGPGEAPLQVLQLEQSPNFRSNLGLNELTGNAVTVQVAAILPDSKVSPSTEVTLAPNEFRQLGGVLASLNPGNTYNARITVRVTGGTGRVTAYGSVIDSLTSDPTYVPAQK